MVTAQKFMLANKEAAKKKKRLELMGAHPGSGLGGASGEDEGGQDQYSASNFDISEAKEKIPAIKEIDQSQRHMNYFKPSMQKPTISQPQIGGGGAGPGSRSLLPGSQQTPQQLENPTKAAAKEYNNFLKEESVTPTASSVMSGKSQQ